MDKKKSKKIISILADGFDPHTGLALKADSPYQHPETIRALFVALQALEYVIKIDGRQLTLPARAGKGWSDKEDKRLTSAFDSGLSIKQLAIKHQRTEGSIRSQLVKLGEMQ